MEVHGNRSGIEFDEKRCFIEKNYVSSSSSSEFLNSSSDSNSSHSSSSNLSFVEGDSSANINANSLLHISTEHFAQEESNLSKRIPKVSESIHPKTVKYSPHNLYSAQTRNTNLKFLNSNYATCYFSEISSYQNNDVTKLGKLKSNIEGKICESHIINDKRSPILNSLLNHKYLKCNETIQKGASVDNKCIESPVSCDICGELFDTIEDVKNHKYTHIICETFPCDICSEYEKKNISCKSSDTNPYNCLTCGKKFNNFSMFGKHIKIHLAVTPFCCETCGKTFNLLNSYQQHLASHKKLYHCTICNDAFKTKLLCHQHKLKHVKKVMHYCESCGKAFRTQSKLKAHSQVHEINKNYECVECGTSYSYKASLMRHNNKYHSLNSKKYRCTQCGEIFKNRLLLRYHTALHTATKIITCSECSRSFACSSSLKRHMFKHKDLQPFTCTVCEMAFSTKRDLRSHISVGHLEDNEKHSLFENFHTSHILPVVNGEEKSNTSKAI